MKTAHLQRILAMVVGASALGARGIACGPCNDDPIIRVVAILPPAVDGGAADGGALDYDDACEKYCGPNALDCEPATIALDGGTMPAVKCTQPGSDCSAGRRPDGLRAPVIAARDPASEWLARAAFLEAASVDAFRTLRRDLAALGAPRRLLRAASRAARDERRHARRMGALARRRGASAEAPRIDEGSALSLEALATLNAAEGCVRETFGALAAHWQAERAADREVRGAMARIAVDETRHAALSWQIDAWARQRLDPAARARVDQARADAARALVAAAGEASPAELTHALGLPDGPTAARLARAMVEALGIAA
jgi:hypothetical protein